MRGKRVLIFLLIFSLFSVVLPERTNVFADEMKFANFGGYWCKEGAAYVWKAGDFEFWNAVRDREHGNSWGETEGYWYKLGNEFYWHDGISETWDGVNWPDSISSCGTSSENTSSDDTSYDEESSYDDYNSDYEKPPVDMTNVTLEKDSLEGTVVGSGYEYNEASFKIKVNSETVLSEYDNAEVRVETSNEDMYFDVSLQKNILSISTSSAGKSTLTVIINEKPFTINVNIKKIGLKESVLIIEKGKKIKLPLEGTDSIKIKWKSSKPDIVSVNKNGKVKGLKEGTALITGKINDAKFYAVVSSVPKIKKKAVEWASKYIENNEYSQPKRMQKGYYDCSSLVWKAYKAYGYKLLGLNYAPTAAELCRMYEQKKHGIKGGVNEKNLKNLKFIPGDLAFFRGEKNGRYKDIYHVELVSGYSFGVDEKGKPHVGINYVKYSEYSENIPVVRVPVY